MHNVDAEAIIRLTRIAAALYDVAIDDEELDECVEKTIRDLRLVIAALAMPAK